MMCQNELRSITQCSRTKCFFFIFVIFSACVQSSLSSWNDFKNNDATKKLRILAAFAHPGKSHFKFFEPLLEELVNRGHDLTVISYFPRAQSTNNTMPNYRDIDLKENANDISVNVVDINKIDDSNIKGFIFELIILYNWGIGHCKKALNNKNVRKLLSSNEKFDLLLTEAFNNDCFLCLADRFDIPIVALSTHNIMPWVQQRFGQPYELSYVSTVFTRSSPSMNFVERLTNGLAHFIANTAYYYITQTSTQKIVNEKCGKGEIRWLSDIAKETSVLLMNTHYSVHGVKPLLPSIVEVGGLHIPRETKSLPEDIKKFLDNAKEGVLYFNLGSMIKSSTMPEDQLRDVVKVIGSLRQKVLWKWEETEFSDKPNNVMLRKWLPQFDILNHPNVKCYLGHGGLLGLSESVYAGVPMVLIPFYGDQFHNSAAVTAKGIAKIVKYRELNEHNLRNALNEVLNDPRYLERARKLSKAYRDRPESPLETAVWWVEYVDRSRNYNYLQSQAVKLTWIQYYMLDVIFTILVIFSIFIYVLYRSVKCIRNFGKRSSYEYSDKKRH